MNGDLPAKLGAVRSGRRGIRARRALLAGLVLVLASCATRWALRTDLPPRGLQWPFAPTPARVVYLASLSGFEGGRGAGTLLHDLAVGRNGGDEGSFQLPVAVATGADGRLAVADMGRRSIHLWIPSEERYLRISSSGNERIASPAGVAFDEERNLFVTDSGGRVMSFGPGGEPRFVLKEAGGERLGRPTGIASSPSKRIFVVDTAAHRVRVFGTDGRYITSFGGRGTGDGELNYPTQIFRSAGGELFVTDSLNFRVQIFDEDGHFRGAFGHHGDGSGDLGMPKGIAVDRDGVIYLVDGLFDNVQLFDRNGEFLLTLGQRGTGFGEFWLPSGAFIDPEGKLYVCDTYNRRVQLFRIVGGRSNGGS